MNQSFASVDGKCEICLRALTATKGEFFYCPICDHGTSPKTYAEMLETYRSDEYAHHLIDEGGSFAEVKRQWTTNIELLKTHCGESGTVLEIGCLDGSGVASLLDAGFDAFGFDVSESAKSQCVANGIDASRIYVADSVSDVSFERQFDILTIREVIEHVPDVDAFLDSARRLVKPGGFAMVQTPRFSDVRGEWSTPEHLRVYSTTSLVYVLRRAGFQIVHSLEWDGGVCLICKRIKSAVVISTYSETDSAYDRMDLLNTVVTCRKTSDCEITIVDDGSFGPYRDFLALIDGVDLMLGKRNRGIAWSKNAGLSIFDADKDIDVVFLVDDDIVFQSPNWEISYLWGLNQVPLLTHSPKHLSEGAIVEGTLLKASLCWGCFVAVSRKCYEAIGKYSTEFPAAYGWEHIEYYYRAAIGGLVPATGFYDIAGSEELLSIADDTDTPDVRERKLQMVEQNRQSNVWQTTEAKYKALSGA